MQNHNMKYLNIPLTEDEYSELLKRKGNKTHKQLLFESLDIDYTRPPMGRPAAFDAAKYEAKMMAIHLEKIRAYNEAHADEAAESRRVLGIDEPGALKPPEWLNKLKRKSEG